MRLFALAALLLSGCVTPGTVTEWPCYSWEGHGEVRLLQLDALEPPEFICSERICYGRTGPQAGRCYYGCPEERMPEYCK